MTSSLAQALRKWVKHVQTSQRGWYFCNWSPYDLCLCSHNLTSFATELTHVEYNTNLSYAFRSSGSHDWDHYAPSVSNRHLFSQMETHKMKDCEMSMGDSTCIKAHTRRQTTVGHGLLGLLCAQCGFLTVLWTWENNMKQTKSAK